jgi:hypothetical protein
LRQGPFGLPQLQIGGNALAILQRDQIDKPLLCIELGAGDIEARLKHPDRNIGVGNLRHDRQARGYGARFGGLPVGARGIARCVTASEQIDFPACAQIDFVHLRRSLKLRKSAADAADGRLQRLIIFAHLTADLCGGSSAALAPLSAARA